jgi:hypothetical protein
VAIAGTPSARKQVKKRLSGRFSVVPNILQGTCVMQDNAAFGTAILQYCQI